MNPQSTPYFLAVSDSAIRAAQACEPYSLPPDKYDLWKDIVLNFDPRDMFGSSGPHSDAPEQVSPVPKVEEAAAAPATTSGAGYVAVLSSQKSREDALKIFGHMQEKYGEVLSGRTPDVQVADIGEKGVWYRLVVGPPGSREAAASLCTQLKSAGYSGCWVTAY